MDGNWIEVEKKVSEKVKEKAQKAGVEFSASEVQQATRDSVKALMMIRAYRMRGHLHADLDPLHLTPPREAPELDPASYGFYEADLGSQDSSITCWGWNCHRARDAGDPAPDLLPVHRRRIHAHLLA